jgi:hypothetical protein
MPREFTCVIITAVNIPPQAYTKAALSELYKNISQQESSHPEAVFIVAGDFNLARFVSCPTRGNNVLDHVYTNIHDVCKAIPRLPLRPIRSLLSVPTPSYMSSANVMIKLEACVAMQSWVNREYRMGLSTHPCGAPVLRISKVEVLFPIFTT